MRLKAVLLAVASILAGLTVHSFRGPASDILGDAIWAFMMFWWVTVVVPTWSADRRALAALAISWLVEFSQLSHAAWLDAARATRLGPLVLGTGFDARDLVSYAVGVLAAWLIAKRTRL